MKLLNATSRTRVFNLEAPFFRARNGGRPEALSMVPRERADVPGQVLECAEVASAVAAGTLRVNDNDPAPPRRGRGAGASDGRGKTEAREDGSD